jgi:hypothetical protein
MIYNLIIIAMFLWYLVYEKNQNEKEKEMLIRELTISLKSKNLEEYKENIPEKEKVVFVKQKEDELVWLEDISPEQLIKAIK